MSETPRLLDEARPVVCTVTVDGRRWRARGTWIDTTGGPRLILALEDGGRVIEHEPAAMPATGRMQ